MRHVSTISRLWWTVPETPRARGGGVVTALAPLVKTMHVQRNPWSCGPCALRHAFLIYGKRFSWKRIARIAQLNAKFDGDTEPRLKNAAYLLGFSMEHRKASTHGHARGLLRFYARNAIPVLMCVDRDRDGYWRHWIVVCTVDARHVWIADSSRPGPVCERLTWRQFLGRAGLYHPGEERFDLYPVVPL
jgi:ABC-type bacteriocin/lantibiotic exporter with double-glycine peptidase domain